MQIIIHELQEVVGQYSEKLNAISQRDFADKPIPTKWSKIEVLGHLIDSAQNNLRRFVCGQYEKSVPLIVYDQDFWVAANDYRHAAKEDVLNLWVLLNQRICDILDTMPESSYDKLCNTGKDIPQMRSLEWLAADYVKHLKHHLNQIIPGSFSITYP